MALTRIGIGRLPEETAPPVGIAALALPALTTVPRFYDEQFRVDYSLSKKWELRVSSLGSDDAMELYASRDQNPDKRFLNRGRFVRLTASAGYHDGPLTAKLSVSQGGALTPPRRVKKACRKPVAGHASPALLQCPLRRHSKAVDRSSCS